MKFPKIPFGNEVLGERRNISLSIKNSLISYYCIIQRNPYDIEINGENNEPQKLMPKDLVDIIIQNDDFSVKIGTPSYCEAPIKINKGQPIKSSFNIVIAEGDFIEITEKAPSEVSNEENDLIFFEILDLASNFCDSESIKKCKNWGFTFDGKKVEIILLPKENWFSVSAFSKIDTVGIINNASDLEFRNLKELLDRLSYILSIYFANDIRIGSIQTHINVGEKFYKKIWLRSLHHKTKNLNHVVLERHRKDGSFFINYNVYKNTRPDRILKYINQLSIYDSKHLDFINEFLVSGRYEHFLEMAIIKYAICLDMLHVLLKELSNNGEEKLVEMYHRLNIYELHSKQKKLYDARSHIMHTHLFKNLSYKKISDAEEQGIIVLKTLIDKLVEQIEARQL